MIQEMTGLTKDGFKVLVKWMVRKQITEMDSVIGTFIQSQQGDSEDRVNLWMGMRKERKEKNKTGHLYRHDLFLQLTLLLFII